MSASIIVHSYWLEYIRAGTDTTLASTTIVVLARIVCITEYELVIILYSCILCILRTESPVSVSESQNSQSVNLDPIFLLALSARFEALGSKLAHGIQIRPVL